MGWSHRLTRALRCLAPARATAGAVAG
jgi:hypothetical protein